MRRSNRLVLLIGVFLAALVFVILVAGNIGGNPSTGGPAASQPPAKIPTVLAAADIPLGTIVTADMLTTENLDPAAHLSNSFINPSLVVGQKVRQAVVKGQQITTDTFGGSSLVNLDVPPGFAAMALQVDQISGVGTLIKAGDYVDAVVGVGSSDPKFPLVVQDQCKATTGCISVPAEQYDHTTVKALLQGVQVLATLFPPPPAQAAPAQQPAAGSPAPTAAPGSYYTQTQALIILSVTPQQAEVLKFAQLDGSISLTLRSTKDATGPDGKPIAPPVYKTTGITLKTLVDSYGVLPPHLIQITLP